MSQELNLTTFGTEKQISALRSASFSDLTLEEFVVAMKIAKQYNLDPFAKEIWGWKSNGKTMIVVSNAGYMRIARSQQGFIALTSNPVFPGDDFSIDFTANEVRHKVDFAKRKKGDTPIGAYAILEYISNGERRMTIKYVSWDEYARGNVWNTHKSAMICKVATTVVCREVYGLSGLYTEEELSPPVKQEETKLIKPDLSRLADIVQAPHTLEATQDLSEREIKGERFSYMEHDDEGTGYNIYNIYDGDNKVDFALTEDQAIEKIKILELQAESENE